MKLSKKLKRKIKTNLKRLFLVVMILLATASSYFALNTKVQVLSENSDVKADNATEKQIKLTDIYKSLGSESDAVTPKIVGGYNYFVSLTADGKVYGWGENSYGQLGTGDTNNQKEPVYLGIDDVIDVAAGSYFNVVLKSDGTVWTIGNNQYGQLGNNTQENSDTFVQVKGENGEGYLKNIKAVAAGYTFAFAITNDNEVYAWGYNVNGELGVGDTTTRLTPTKTQFTGITQITAGQNHTVALDEEGNVWTVGYNNFGQLGIGNRTSTSTPQKILSTGAKEVACGRRHTVVLKTDGTVWVTGYNGDTGLGNHYYVLGLGGSGSSYRDGSFSLNGTTYYIHKLRQMRGTNTSTYITDGEHISANGDVTYVTSQAGGMYTVGVNNYGGLFTGNATKYYYAPKVQTSKTIVDMAVTKSGNTGAYVDDIGRIYTVGYSAEGELGNGTTATAYGYIPYSISDYKLLVTPEKISMKTGSTQTIDVKLKYNDEPYEFILE